MPDDEIQTPQTEVTKFEGMWSNKDPHNLNAGEATVQINCLSRREGELVVRGGLRELVGETE